MNGRNPVALAPLLAALFFERLAYYAFRSGAFARILADGASAASYGSIATGSTVALLVGLAVGGTVSVFVRHRLVLAGALVGVAMAHAVGAASAVAGMFFVGLTAGAMRPLLMMAIAEELAGGARIWRGIAVASLLGAVVDVASALGGAASRFTSPRGFGAGLPVLPAMIAVVCGAIVAFGFPGAPFAWAPPKQELVQGDGLYRPAPEVVRSTFAPPPGALGIAIVAAYLGSWEQYLSSTTIFRLGTPHASTLAYVVPTMAGLLAAAVTGAIAILLVSNASRASALGLLAAALGGVALGAFVMAGAMVVGSSSLGLVASFVGNGADGALTAVALGLALAVPSSRFSGLGTAALGAAFLVPPVALHTLAPHVDEDGSTGALGAVGVACAAVAVVSLVLAPSTKTPAPSGP